MGFHTFLKGIITELNVIARLGIELSYFAYFISSARELLRHRNSPITLLKAPYIGIRQ